MMDDKHHGIFGSPPEPVFNLRPIGMKPELLEEWLLVLANENAETTKSATDKAGLYKSGDCAEFVFLTCEKLRLGAEAKYLTIEMLDKFMLKHINDLYSHVLASGSKNPKKDWDGILDRVQVQIPLRVVSCCQLASKLTSHYRIISPRRVQRTLHEFGYDYNLSSILQSELRVLKTLNYKVMITSPLVYLETLLEILGHNDPESEVKVYHGTCLVILDYLYIRRDDIYDELYQLVTHNSTPSSDRRKMFAKVESDNMLLAVALITAASYILEQNRTDKVIEGLSQITRIQAENIIDFATIIVQHFIGT